MSDDGVNDDDFVMALLAEDLDGDDDEDEEYKPPAAAAAAAKNGKEVIDIDGDDETSDDRANHKSAAAKGKKAKGKSTTTKTSRTPRPKMIRVLQGKQAHIAVLLQEDKKKKLFFVEWASNSKKEWIPQNKWAIETIESDHKDEGRKSRLAREKRPFRYVPPTEETNSNSNSNSNASSSNGSSRKKSKQTHAGGGGVGVEDVGVSVEDVDNGVHNARPAPLKKTTSSTASATSASSLVGQKVAKYFEGESLYFGTITSTKRVKEVGTSRSGRQLFKQCWHIQYDDGDEEDMERDEVHEAIALYHEHQQQQEQKEKEKAQKSNPTKATKGKKTSPAAVDRYKSPDKKRTSTTRHGKEEDKVAVPHAVTPPPPSSSSSSSAATTSPTTPTAAAGNPLDGVVKRFSDSFPYKGAKVAKFFDKTLYYGTVVSCLLDEENTHIFERVSKMTKKSDEVLPSYVWHVNYSDGDSEDLDLVELQQGLELYRSRRIKGYKSKSSKDAAAAAASSTQKDEVAEEGSSEDAADGIDTDTGTYWEVDDILERRFRKMAGGVQVVQYLVKWKGWRDEKGNDSTWVPAECLDKNSLRDAWEKFPDEIEELKTPPNEGKAEETIVVDADSKTEAMDIAATDINATGSTGEAAETDAQKGPTNEATDGNAKVVSTDEEAAGASAEKHEIPEAASNFDGTKGKESEVAHVDEAESDSSKTLPTVSETSGSANESNTDPDETKEPKKSGSDVATRATRLSATMAPVPVQEKKQKKHRKENFNDSDSEDDDDDDDIEEGDYNRTGTALS